MNFELQSDLARLNSTIADYIRVGKKLPEEALAKQAGKLGFAFSQELRGLIPPKGSIRSESLARLKGGGGIRVRPSVRKAVFEKRRARQDLATRDLVFGAGKRGTRSIRRQGKRLNLQALAVTAEINIRERGRGFLSVSSRIPRFTRALGDVQRSLSRYGPILGEAGLRAAPEGAEARFLWGPHSRASLAAARGLSIPKAEAALSRALNAVAEDIRLYIEEKFRQRVLR
jgi:hypothetical protein